MTTTDETTTPSLPALDESWSRALCVVAHPDDLEYGTAAAVDRWVGQGKTVSYLLATRGEAGIDTMSPVRAGPVREQEERDGAAEVGVHTVEFLGHQDGVVEYGLPLRRDLAAGIRRHRPDVILSINHHQRFPGGFTNQADHVAVGQAVLDAARDAANRWVFPELVAEGGLEPWAGARLVAFAASPQPTHWLDVSEHVAPAVRSLQAHRQYLEALGAEYPSPRELLDQILGGAGRAMGVEHALTFEVFDL